jgi:hypothetical protein
VKPGSGEPTGFVAGDVLPGNLFLLFYLAVKMRLALLQHLQRFEAPPPNQPQIPDMAVGCEEKRRLRDDIYGGRKCVSRFVEVSMCRSQL